MFPFLEYTFKIVSQDNIVLFQILVLNEVSKLSKMKTALSEIQLINKSNTKMSDLLRNTCATNIKP